MCENNCGGITWFWLLIKRLFRQICTVLQSANAIQSPRHQRTKKVNSSAFISMVIGFNLVMETFSIALGNVPFAQTSQCRDSSVRLWRVCGGFFCPLIFYNSARGRVNYMACWLRSPALALIGRFRVISLGWQYEELTRRCWISQRKRWRCLQSQSSLVWELPGEPSKSSSSMQWPDWEEPITKFS